MQKRTFALLSLVALLATALVASTASAQPGVRGAPGGGGPGGMGGGLLRLLEMQAVQEEIDALDWQLEKIAALRNEARGERPTGDWRNMSEQERAQAMEEMRGRAAAAEEKLADILVPPQMNRLRELSLQQRGVRALTDPQVVEQLKLTPQVVEKVTAQLEENQNSMREQMREIMQGGNRETAGERMQQLRQEMDGKVLAVLSGAQQAGWKEMLGEDFEFPRGQFGAPGGRGTQPRQEGAGGGRGRGAGAGQRGQGRQGGAGGGQRGPRA